MRLIPFIFLIFALPLQAETVTVFAAASLGDALADAAQPWQEATGHDVVISAAGSATLARQIDLGAPADLFVSANAEWMDWLADRRRIDTATRRVLAGNTLVLAMPSLGGTDQEITPDYPLLAMLGDGRLATALTDAVPAGIYAKQALQSLGFWDAVKDRLAETDNVRAALALVALGEVPLGIVYATDVLAEPGVLVVGRFPAGSHDPITYPAAVIAESARRDSAVSLLDWLSGPQAQAVLAAHGFEAAR
ncbi:molybdate ABC transporter substrate-binding protein [Thalassococcus sp. CAU 1522]|uniref:Molybdate ABC transporter substrate-binding protein n=1 Tax=Thalassococcus arenae TaxID=2851652 RepID=A0ABS6N8U2_9RHOB|nr:molybdate ABC transporter substrate-binding protein [Thalassococcus arenae]MBV2360107.1 molybdate ABC transporter substrate-binding protein [Thalassococcus arenae]